MRKSEEAFGIRAIPAVAAITDRCSRILLLFESFHFIDRKTSSTLRKLSIVKIREVKSLEREGVFKSPKVLMRVGVASGIFS